MPLGPVDVYIIGFPGNQFKGEIVPEILKQVAEAGHSIGNHTWSHKNLARMSDAQRQGYVADAEAFLDRC